MRDPDTIIYLVISAEPAYAPPPALIADWDAARTHARRVSGFIYEVELRDLIDNWEFGVIDDDLFQELDHPHKR